MARSGALAWLRSPQALPAHPAIRPRLALDQSHAGRIFRLSRRPHRDAAGALKLRTAPPDEALPLCGWSLHADRTQVAAADFLSKTIGESRASRQPLPSCAILSRT